MLDFLVRVLINGAALIITAKVLPDQIRLPIGPPGIDWLKIVAVALVFALVNSYIKPIVKALSFPISMMTLGLVAFVINAVLLLLVAGIDGATDQGRPRRRALPAQDRRRHDRGRDHRRPRPEHRVHASGLRELRAKAGRAPLTR